MDVSEMRWLILNTTNTISSGIHAARMVSTLRPAHDCRGLELPHTQPPARKQFRQHAISIGRDGETHVGIVRIGGGHIHHADDHAAAYRAMRENIVPPIAPSGDRYERLRDRIHGSRRGMRRESGEDEHDLIDGGFQHAYAVLSISLLSGALQHVRQRVRTAKCAKAKPSTPSRRPVRTATLESVRAKRRMRRTT